MQLNFVSGNSYLGDYLRPREYLEAWVQTQLEAWAQRFIILVKISKRPLKLDYISLGIFLQLEWQYLQRTVFGVGTLMGPVE